MLAHLHRRQSKMQQKGTGVSITINLIKHVHSYTLDIHAFAQNAVPWNNRHITHISIQENKNIYKICNRFFVQTISETLLNENYLWRDDILTQQ